MKITRLFTFSLITLCLSFSVQAVLMESLLKKHSLPEVDLLKIDIEGAEHNILEKTPECFLKFKYIYIEIHGSIQKREDFRTKLTDLGFTLAHRKSDDSTDCEISFFKRNA